MSRFHIHISVENLNESIQFYSALFGQEPAKIKPNYAKWMLENPRINFAISDLAEEKGLNHLGLQVDSSEELATIRNRVASANLQTYDEGETICCYAKSEKTWVNDPTGIAWEAYQTMEDAELFISPERESGCCDSEEQAPKQEKSSCCEPKEKAEVKQTASCCG